MRDRTDAARFRLRDNGDGRESNSLYLLDEDEREETVAGPRETMYMPLSFVFIKR